MSDSSDTIVFANSAASILFGYPVSDLLGLVVPHLLSVTPDGHILGHRSDRTELPVESVHTTFERSGNALTVRFISDVTERRDAERKIREYQDKLQRAAFDAALAEEKERRRIAIGIHDGIGQSLALAQVKLAMVKKDLGAKGNVLGEAIGLIDKSIADARSLTFELTPPVLYDLGLKAALSWLAEDLEKRHGLNVTIDNDQLDPDLDSTRLSIIFRAVREVLVNVWKHAGVKRATVRMRTTNERLAISITDKGAGFDLADLDGVSQADAFGLFSVREQMAHMDGSVEIVSTKGEGTSVTLNVPFEAKVAGKAKP